MVVSEYVLQVTVGGRCLDQIKAPLRYLCAGIFLTYGRAHKESL